MNKYPPRVAVVGFGGDNRHFVEVELHRMKNGITVNLRNETRITGTLWFQTEQDMVDFATKLLPTYQDEEVAAISKVEAEPSTVIAQEGPAKENAE